MSVNIFSLEGNLQVGGMAEAKAGLEGVAAAGKEAAAALNSSGGGVLGGFPAATAQQMGILAQAETTFKKMGLAGEELENSMKAAARGMGVSMPAAAAEAEAAVLGAGVATAGTSEKVKEGTKTWAEHGRGLGETIERYRGLLEIYGLLKVVEFTSRAIDQAASLHELSQKTGATVEMLSLLEFAGRRANVSADNLAQGFRGLSMSLLNLSADTSPKVVEAYTKIGLSAKDFQGLNTDEAFKKIVLALAPYPDGMAKGAIANEIFGRSGSLLIPLLDDLATDGFDKTTAAGKRFHAIFGKDVSDEADHFKDSIGDLRFELEALARVLIGPLNYGLTNLVKVMTGDLHKEFLDFAKGFDKGSFGLFPGMYDHLARKWAVMDSSNPEATGDPGHRAGKVLSPFSGDNKGSKDENPLGTEISLLKEKFELNRAGVKDLTRLFVLEGQLEQALDRKNLSMKEELKLARDLADARTAIAAALAPLAAPDTVAGGQYRPVDQKGRLDLGGYIGGLSGMGDGKGSKSDAVNKQYEDQLRAGESLKLQFATLGQNLGMAVANSFAVGLSAAFQGKNPFKAFGNALIGAIGGIMVQMGQAMIAQGIILTGLLPALSNPFTSGPALIAAGVLLSALGMTLGAIMHGSGPGGGGGGSFQKDQVTQVHLTADGAGGWMAPQTNQQPPIKVLGKDSPEGQRLFAEYGGKVSRRGF